MKFRNLFIVLLVGFGFIFASCSDDESEQGEITTGIFILNQGGSEGNNAGITAYNPETGAITRDIYRSQNGKDLGDTGQDMIVYGDKVYVSVYGSSRLVKMDKNGVERASLSFDVSTDGQPRYIEAEDGKLYVTLYSGQVARIDTATLQIEAYVSVGNNPEQIVEENGKLYVANSGWGSGTTVSVIDIATFKVVQTLDVALNPNDLLEAGDNVYVLSWGNYADIPYALQKINVQTGAVESITPATKMVENEDIIYLVNSVTNWNVKPNVTTNTFFSYDTKQQKLNETSFLKLEGEAKTLETESVYMMAVDPHNGDFYVGTSDYVNTGKIYRFSRNGTLIKKFGSGGISPCKALFF